MLCGRTMVIYWHAFLMTTVLRDRAGRLDTKRVCFFIYRRCASLTLLSETNYKDAEGLAGQGKNRRKCRLNLVITSFKGSVSNPRFLQDDPAMTLAAMNEFVLHSITRASGSDS